jgi:SAM-dependent methyltransferase
MSTGLKDEVRRFWDAAPCGTRDVRHPEGSAAYFDVLEANRDQLEPFIAQFARFQSWKDRRVLEVGVGAATDFVRFARAGAVLSGIDLTPHAAALARQRLELEGLAADVRVGDAESLPFADGEFDFVYSWGVIHHTADTPAAAREIVRVTRPGGEVCVMIYHRHSLVGLQCWLAYGLARGRPWRSIGDVLWHHVESPGTKAYTVAEARALFAGLEDLRVTPVVTPYDLRVGHSRFLSRRFQRLVPARLGWFLVVEGRKPAGVPGAERAA